MRTISRLKDTALQKGLTFLLRPKLVRYGELRHITLDTSNKTLTAEIDLLGDPTPLTVSQAYYQLERTGAHLFLTIRDVKVSKPWIQHLIEDHFPEARIKVPQSLHGVLNRLL